MSFEANRRILLVDDNPAIHEDFRKILGANNRPAAELRDVKAAFFGAEDPAIETPTFELASAHQSEEAIQDDRHSNDATERQRVHEDAALEKKLHHGWVGISGRRRRVGGEAWERTEDK